MNAPTDELAPVGWVCTRNDPGEIIFEHEEWPNTVRAIRESEDLWRVEMVEHAGEAESTRTVGYACTRDRALDALSTSMSAMNRVADRTGVVRTMMASTLALYDDAGIRDVTPDWRAADRPFERQVPTEVPRRPWRRADDAWVSTADNDPDSPDAADDPAADADAVAPDEDGDTAGSDERRSAPSQSSESPDEGTEDGT